MTCYWLGVLSCSSVLFLIRQALLALLFKFAFKILVDVEKLQMLFSLE